MRVKRKEPEYDAFIWEQVDGDELALAISEVVAYAAWQRFDTFEFIALEGNHAYAEARPGDVIVVDGEGTPSVFTAEQFAKQFEWVEVTSGDVG